MDYQAIADNIVMMCAVSESEPVTLLSKRVEDQLRQVAHAEYLLGVKDTLTMKREGEHANARN